MAEPDDLFSLRNLFWLGNFQKALNEASALNRLSPHLRPEKEEYVYRSYMALGQYNLLLDEIAEAPSTPVALRALKVLASYLSKSCTDEVAMLYLGEYATDTASANNTTLQLVTALMHMYMGNTQDAISTVRHGTTMEHCALLVQLYLRMDRTDLAQKQLQQMQQADEDATLTQLASAWVNMALGGAKLQEAAYTFEELINKYGGSCMLFNSLAVAHMHMANYSDAERSLQEALGKSPNDSDTLANLIVVSQHMERERELINRYTSQLRAACPEHPLLVSQQTMSGAFERVAQTLSRA